MSLAQALAVAGVTPACAQDFQAVSIAYRDNHTVATDDDELENPQMLASFLNMLMAEVLAPGDGGLVPMTASMAEELDTLTAGVAIEL